MTHVLVVDDEPGLRESIAYVLEDEGYAVETAANGQRALALADGHTPDLVLLDLSMPVLDGWGFLRERQGRDGLARVPVVVMSATAGTGIEAALALGAEAYLPKPFDFDALVALVERLAPAP